MAQCSSESDMTLMFKMKVTATFIRTVSFFEKPTGQRLINNDLNPLRNNQEIQSSQCKLYQDSPAIHGFVIVVINRNVWYRLVTFAAAPPQ